MMTSRFQRLLVEIRSAAECCWLALETVGWMILYHWRGLLLRVDKWRHARLVKQVDALKLECER